MPNLIETIKMAAIDAINASNPTAILFGTVQSTNPLLINIEQRLTLDDSHLILTSLVSDFEMEMTMNHLSEETSGGTGESSFENHKHAVIGKKAVQVHLGLKVNESVILLQMQGGQKYLVLDRVR